MKKFYSLIIPLFMLAAVGMYSCEGSEDTVAVTGVKLNKNSVPLKTGETAKLTATVLPDDATDKTVSWKSSDDTVATVADGLVTAVTDGEATITVTTADGGKTAVCTVTVSKDIVNVTGVTLDKETLSLDPEETAQLNHTVLPDDATDKSVSWESSDESIVKVTQSGAVTAVSAGQATITVTTNDGNKTAECKVTVVIHVTDVALNKTDIELAPGTTTLLVPTVTPAGATDKTVSWTSSDDRFAKVDQNGLVTAVAIGEATITATTTDGGKTAQCKVTVKNVPVSGVTLNETVAELAPEHTLQLTASVKPDDATDKSVTWSSSDNSVATVSQSGLVTAMAAGQATITVKTNDGDHTATCAVTVLNLDKWARSNIVWIADSSKPEGGYLTFAVDPTDNATIKANVGGLFFKWGSLVAVSLVGNTYGADQIIFSPTGSKNYAWTEIPSLSGYTAPPFDNNVQSEDDFASYNNGTGFNETAGTGDICRYISAKGWVQGKWRMPTGKEFNDLTAGGKAVWSGSTWANVTVPAGNNNEYGFYEFASGYFLGDGATASDNRANPAKGVSIPVASYRRVYDGGQTSAGNYGSYWTGSSRLTTEAYGLDVYSSLNLVNSSRGYGSVVRCVRE
jgi:uncharacterized protein YjdB